MTTALYAAISTWAKGAAPFNGGPVAGPWTGDLVPPGTAFPYAVVEQVGGGAPLDWTTDHTAIEPLRIQFSIFTNTTKQQAFNYAKQLTDRFDLATLSPASGLSLGCLRILGPMSVPSTERDADGNRVWHVTADYRITLQT